MLNYIKIKSLFGLYTYNLDFIEQDAKPVKFITGPNGYGKTTILLLINSLYSGQFENFFLVPFESIEFRLTDTIIIIDRICETSTADNDDEPKDNVNLEVSFGKSIDELKKILIKKDSAAEEFKDLKMFLDAFSCFYIKDQRLYRKPAVVDTNLILNRSTVSDDVNDLKNKLFSVRMMLVETLLSQLFSRSESDNQEDGSKAEDLKKQSIELFEKFQSYGMMDVKVTMADLGKMPSVISEIDIDIIERRISELNDFFKRLEVFCTIIKNYDFADKELEINPQYGYRFKVRNAAGTLLSPDSLSSGEQHILIMTYELIFRAQNDSLVLIDEPELSSHLIWQLEFLKTVLEILDVRNNRLQFIIATHSPQIFGEKWDLSIDLFKQSQMYKNCGDE